MLQNGLNFHVQCSDLQSDNPVTLSLCRVQAESELQVALGCPLCSALGEKSLMNLRVLIFVLDLRSSRLDVLIGFRKIFNLISETPWL